MPTHLHSVGNFRPLEPTTGATLGGASMLTVLIKSDGTNMLAR